MRWNKEAFRGTSRVFRFSLTQQMKSRVNQAMLLLLFVIAAAAVPVMALKTGKADRKTELQISELRHVYVKNDTPLEIELQTVGELEPALGHTEFSRTELSAAEFALEEKNRTPQDTELLQSEYAVTDNSQKNEYAASAAVETAAGNDGKKKEYNTSAAGNDDQEKAKSAPTSRDGGQTLGEKEALAVFSPEEPGYRLDLYQSETSELSQEDMDILEEALLQAFEHAQITAAGASPETMQELELPLDIQRLSWEEYRNPEDTDWETQFVLQYGYALLVMILCTMTSSYIVRSIAEEKSSRLVELLLVSVSPLSLLLGKVLAMMAYILSEAAAIAAGAGLSWLVCGRFLDLSGISLTAALGIAPGSLNLGVGLILTVIICTLLGYLTFSLTAGLAGCCCSSMDDVERENVMVVLLIMAGYLFSSIGSPFFSGFACTIVSVLPLVSVFCAPVQYALGNIGFGVLALSWIVQAAMITVLAFISARVYQELILYKGSQAGFRRLLHMAGTRRGGNDR